MLMLDHKKVIFFSLSPFCRKIKAFRNFLTNEYNFLWKIERVQFLINKNINLLRVHKETYFIGSILASI